MICFSCKERKEAMKGILRSIRPLGALLVVLLAVCAWSGPIRPAVAGEAENAQQLVDKARMTMDAFVADKEMGPPLKELLKKARGVLIYPQVLRGAFIFGVSGGSGTFLAYDEKAKKWGGPAFYTIGEVSFGAQAGGDASEVVLVALSERGMTALLATSAKLGADAGVTLGPVGAGAEAATANLSADIISYSRSKGLYAGMSVEGAVVATRDALNKAYYGKEVSPTNILVRRTVSNKKAAGLISAVSKAAGK
jgi:SH3 domain-containing YSC84-like protein 1